MASAPSARSADIPVRSNVFRAKLAENQRLRASKEAYSMWQARVILECRIVFPARMNVQQSRVAKLPKTLMLKQPASWRTGTRLSISASATAPSSPGRR